MSLVNLRGIQFECSNLFNITTDGCRSQTADDRRTSVPKARDTTDGRRSPNPHVIQVRHCLFSFIITLTKGTSSTMAGRPFDFPLFTVSCEECQVTNLCWRAPPPHKTHTCATIRGAASSKACAHRAAFVHDTVSAGTVLRKIAVTTATFDKPTVLMQVQLVVVAEDKGLLLTDNDMRDVGMVIAVCAGGSCHQKTALILWEPQSFAVLFHYLIAKPYSTRLEVIAGKEEEGAAGGEPCVVAVGADVGDIAARLLTEGLRVTMPPLRLWWYSDYQRVVATMAPRTTSRSLAYASAVGASVAGASVAGASVAGASVAGASVAGASVAGASVVCASVAGASVAGASVAGVSAAASASVPSAFVVGV